MVSTFTASPARNAVAFSDAETLFDKTNLRSRSLSLSRSLSITAWGLLCYHGWVPERMKYKTMSSGARIELVRAGRKRPLMCDGLRVWFGKVMFEARSLRTCLHRNV
jgi:hypothetical protein